MKSTPVNFSIKWKLSLALIATGLSLVVIYVVIAKKVFESDKISYVFEAQNSRLNSLKREMDHRFEQTLVSSKALLTTVDGLGKMSAAAMDLFNEDRSILAIELRNEATNQSLFKAEKSTGLLSSEDGPPEKIGIGEVKLLPLKNQNFLLFYHLNEEKGTLLLARVLMDGHDFLPPNSVNQPLVLSKDGEIISSVSTANFRSDVVQELVQALKNDNEIEHTSLWKYKTQSFLVSSATLVLGHLKVIAFTPEQEALGALKTLFYRSLIFLVFSAFGLIIISLLLAKKLTSNLEILTLTATEIGQGNFNQTPAIKTNDEMGVLAKAIIKMSKEIIRLLEETRDKARMESELKTAKLVQESLFPTDASISINEIEINGMIVSSTECGGDWWYYFTQGDDVYIAIADATGHGTPAALITASARSIFSRLEMEKMSLSEMMRAWDFAVSSCSKGRVFMTGLLMKINSKTGAGSYLSAGHESPFLFNSTDDVYTSEFLDLDIHPVLGEDLSQCDLEEQHFQLNQNSSLVLYTDGLFSVENSEGKKLSERRLGKAIAEKLEFYTSAESITGLVLKKFEEHRKELPLPDDVTLLTVRRKGTARETHLENDSGKLTSPSIEPSPT